MDAPPATSTPPILEIRRCLPRCGPSPGPALPNASERSRKQGNRKARDGTRTRDRQDHNQCTRGQGTELGSLSASRRPRSRYRFALLPGDPYRRIGAALPRSGQSKGRPGALASRRLPDCTTASDHGPVATAATGWWPERSRDRVGARACPFAPRPIAPGFRRLGLRLSSKAVRPTPTSADRLRTLGSPLWRHG